MYYIILFILLCTILAIIFIYDNKIINGGSGGSGGSGGAVKSPHIIVDTLNLTHWYHGNVSTQLISDTIDRSAPILKKNFAGRIMYVLKDRESKFNSQSDHVLYKKLASKYGIYIIVAEKYIDPPKGVSISNEHSAMGRDDFYISILARRWKCAVLTEDRLRDFLKFRATIQPFHVYEFSYWSDSVQRDYIRPESSDYAYLRRPKLLRFSTYFEK